MCWRRQVGGLQPRDYLLRCVPSADQWIGRPTALWSCVAVWNGRLDTFAGFRARWLPIVRAVIASAARIVFFAPLLLQSFVEKESGRPFRPPRHPPVTPWRARVSLPPSLSTLLTTPVETLLLFLCVHGWIVFDHGNAHDNDDDHVKQRQREG